MPFPLFLAAPAALTSLAYLNARLSLSYDYKLISSLIRAAATLRSRTQRDRVNLYYKLEDWADSTTDASRVFLVYQGQELTYRQTYDIVLQYGLWLKTWHHVQKGEIVAMNFMNGLEFMFVWLALWSIGATPAFINYNLTGKSLIHCIKTSTAGLLLVGEEVQHTLSEDVRQALESSSSSPKGPVVIQVMDAKPKAEIARCESIRQDDSLRSEAKSSGMAILIFTSGTTGMPKAAIVSWDKCNYGATFASGWLGIRKTDRFYTCMPLYHGTAAILGGSLVINAGSTLVIGHKFSTKRFWPEVRASKATIIQYVGETCRYLLAAPPQLNAKTGENLDKQNDVRIAFGNGMRPDVWYRFKERFDVESIGEFYSATESSSGSWNFSSNDFGAGAVGRNGALVGLLRGSTTAVVELDWETEQPIRDGKTGFCLKAPSGKPGELLYRLDEKNISESFQGYYNNTGASEKKVLRDVFRKGDAFFRTGDVFRWDNEGRWFFNDRLGDTYRWKGENVSTSEVSEALGSHPSVREANVYGVSLPHHDGRAGCVALVLTQDPTQEILDSILEKLKSSLPRYAIPLFLRITKDLERTGNNKQQKHTLRMEGVEPAKTKDSQLFWLKDGRYVPYAMREWQELEGGRVRL
ncbi:MAG: hypothetical protein M1814_005896 [Vezdaea aestivalis]|nr:MAG: hypothetical protein M1814_005896 [Vezdaea aestivalis]